MVRRSCRLEPSVNRSPEPDFGEPRPLFADEAEAVDKLYRSVAPELYPRALLMAQGNRAQADDLIQQAFQAAIMAWARVGHLDLGRQKAWLYGVLRYKAIDTWRASEREHPVPDLDSYQLQSPQDTAHHALCSMALDRVLKVVFEMPPVRHRVMWLYVMEGLPTNEIAGLLGIAQSTVRGHLKAARDTLSKEVGPILPFSDDDAGDDDLPRERW
jgi:RNA polymerase sigma-70 factor (ECF subfamily)